LPGEEKMLKTEKAATQGKATIRQKKGGNPQQSTTISQHRLDPQLQPKK